VAAGLARPWLNGIPTMIQPAASGFYGEADELRRTRGSGILRWIILRNTAFAAISAEIERQWLEMGVPSARMVRTASGVDAEHFHPGPSQVEHELLPHPRVLFTGRLHPQKNLPLLLESWSRVTRRTPANLILLGPGGDREALVEMAARLGIADRVQFVAAVADTAEHLRAADLFVLPSLAEGMSNSLLEAMASGLPCIVSGIGGNTDLISDRVTGRLVPSPMADAWADTIIELLEDPAQAACLGRSARKRIDEEFSIRVVVDRYLALYRELIAGRFPG
jgi:glycosyltransferase involved in cell wall biosynthesis